MLLRATWLFLQIRACFEGVLIIGALLFRVYIRALSVGNSHLEAHGTE